MTLASLVQELVDLPEQVLRDYVAAVGSEPVNAESLIVLIAAIRDCTDDLHALRKRITEDLGSEFAPSKTIFQVPELGAIEVSHKNVRTAWDKETLLPQALSRITDKRGVLCDEDGVTHPPAVIAQNIYRELAKIVSFGAPKAAIKDLGFDPDDYSKSRWETQVKLPRRV